MNEPLLYAVALYKMGTNEFISFLSSDSMSLGHHIYAFQDIELANKYAERWDRYNNRDKKIEVAVVELKVQ